MRNLLSSRGRSQVLRLLTLVSFINFSGVHNGYSALIAASPLNVRQSATLAGGMVGHLQFLFNPAQALDSLSAARNRVARFVFSVQRSTRTAFQRTASAFQSLGASRMPSRDFRKDAADNAFGENPRMLGWKKETYLKERKWGRAKFILDAGQTHSWRTAGAEKDDERGAPYQAWGAAETARIASARKMHRRRAAGSGDGSATIAIDDFINPSSSELGFFI